MQQPDKLFVEMSLMKPRVIYRRLCILHVVALPVVPQAFAADAQSDRAGSSMVFEPPQPVVEEREDDCE